jgi:hypothetical protein
MKNEFLSWYIAKQIRSASNQQGGTSMQVSSSLSSADEHVLQCRVKKFRQRETRKLHLPPSFRQRRKSARCAGGRKIMCILMARHAAAILLASAIGCSSALAEVETISKCSYWDAFAGALDGRIVTGAATTLTDGSLAAIVISQDNISLRLYGRAWGLDAGDLTRIRIVAGNTSYRGKARAINDSEFEVADLPKDFLQALIISRTAFIEINSVRWLLNLEGLSSCLKDAVTLYVKTLSRR